MQTPFPKLPLTWEPLGVHLDPLCRERSTSEPAAQSPVGQAPPRHVEAALGRGGTALHTSARLLTGGEGGSRSLIEPSLSQRGFLLRPQLHPSSGLSVPGGQLKKPGNIKKTFFPEKK